MAVLCMSVICGAEPQALWTLVCGMQRGKAAYLQRSAVLRLCEVWLTVCKHAQSIFSPAQGAELLRAGPISRGMESASLKGCNYDML